MKKPSLSKQIVWYFFKSKFMNLEGAISLKRNSLFLIAIILATFQVNVTCGKKYVMWNIGTNDSRKLTRFLFFYLEFIILCLKALPSNPLNCCSSCCSSMELIEFWHDSSSILVSVARLCFFKDLIYLTG